MESILSLLREVESSTLSMGEAIPSLRVLVACQVEARAAPFQYPDDILCGLFAGTPYTLSYEEYEEGRFLWFVKTKVGIIPVYE